MSLPLLNAESLDRWFSEDPSPFRSHALNFALTRLPFGRRQAFSLAQLLLQGLNASLPDKVARMGGAFMRKKAAIEQLPEAASHG